MCGTTARADERPDTDDRLEPLSTRDAESVLRIGEADPDVRRVARDGMQAWCVEGRDDGAPLEVEAAERRGQLVEPGLELQVDVEPDVWRLVDEERQRLVEGRQRGRHLSKLLERERPYRPGGRAMAHLLEVIRVREHEWAARQVEHVELDEIDAVRDRRTQRGERVLGSEVRSPAMADPKHRRTFGAAQLDQGCRRFTARSHSHARGARTSA